MKAFDLTYFNVSPQFRRIGKVLYKPYNLFNRQNMQMADGSAESCWGFGLLQINSRHLFYVGVGTDSQFRLDIAFIQIA
ncbi:hypothetical protein GGR92_004809 [Spirosoma lacussanchae]